MSITLHKYDVYFANFHFLLFEVCFSVCILTLYVADRKFLYRTTDSRSCSVRTFFMSEAGMMTLEFVNEELTHAKRSDETDTFASYLFSFTFIGKFLVEKR